jgi:hypothetical protein
MTRESWLNSLAEVLRPAFKRAGFPLPDKLHISCGWPTRRALITPTSKSRTMGQCFGSACSSDGHSEIFITPALADSMEVAEVLVHELCHAALDCDGGHGPQFRKVATAMGLSGKMTSTHAGQDLARRLNDILGSMAKYPHATLDKLQPGKKEGTRLIKIICGDCGWTGRTTQMWIEEGLPTCQCGGEIEVAPPPSKGKKKPAKRLIHVFDPPPAKPKKRKAR